MPSGEPSTQESRSVTARHRARVAAWLVGLASAGCIDGGQEPVSFSPSPQPELATGGALVDAWADVDGDGDPDRFVGFNGAPSRLYRNDGSGGFVDVASELGLVVERPVRTGAWGDFDADGDPDLFLGFAGEGPVTALYRNDGGALTEVSGEVGLRLAAGVTRQASWIDRDGDGDLDLFLAMRDGPNRLFENRLPEPFADVGGALGIGDARRSVGAVWLDVDQDGRLDVVVANMDGDANGVLVQRPDGSFTPWEGEASVRDGGRALGDEAQGSVRPCAVDYDNDGDLDLFFANYGPNGLFERTSRAGGPFVAVAAAVGLAIDSHYDTCTWGDFDHDGLPDLYVNGTVGGDVQYRDWLLRREGGGAFVDVTTPEILALASSHGARWIDVDLDGDLDLALAGAAEDGTHTVVVNLLRPERRIHALAVRILDADGHATLPGAEVRLYAAGTSRVLGTRLVDTGSGYDAQSDVPVHFGLRGPAPVDVEITTAGGGRRRVTERRTVEPAAHVGGVLEIRIDREGRIASLATRRPGAGR